MAAPDELTDETVTEEITGGVVSTAAVPEPVTDRAAVPAFELKPTLFAKLPATVGLNRTTTVWLVPAVRPNEPPETTPNGAAMDAVPVSVPPPEFVTVNERSTDPPTVTTPKSTVVWGATDKVGPGMAVPVPVTEGEAVLALELKVAVLAKVPAAVGLNRATTVWLVPAPRLNALPETTLKGTTLEAVPVRVPPPVLVTVNERSADPPTATAPKSTLVEGVTERVGAVAGGGSIPLIAPTVAARTASISAPRSLPSVPAFL